MILSDFDALQNIYLLTYLLTYLQYNQKVKCQILVVVMSHAS